jgi:hypothetical protein
MATVIVSVVVLVVMVVAVAVGVVAVGIVAVGVVAVGVVAVGFVAVGVLQRLACCLKCVLSYVLTLCFSSSALCFLSGAYSLCACS